jgi:hypothetical protein
MKQDTSLTGAAGEHLVLSRLLSRGILAAQAPRGTRKADILVNHLDKDSTALIQVKSRLIGADGGWHMNQKHELIKEDDIWYCFVDFEPDSPKVYVVPSLLVATVVTEENESWMRTPGKGGKMHNKTEMRRILPKYPYEVPSAPDGWINAYSERWDFLE